MARKLTQEEVVKNIYNKVGDEYTLLSEYKNANTKLKMRHNKCCHPDGFYIWDITYHNFMDSNHRCPYESHQVKITTDDFNKKLQEINPSLTCMSEYINSGTDVDIYCSKCGFTFKRTPENLFSINGGRCPICNKSKINYVIKGYNDIWTTNPNVASLLKDKNWGYTHTYNTHEKTEFICPRCGKILYKIPSIVYNDKGEIVCNYCSDGISYPEKFFIAVLNQLNINDYITQLNSSYYKWIGKYRYDFYLKSINCIVETHGGQHYEEFANQEYFNKQSDIDIKKKKLAISNGIKLYIELDCRHSNMEWIKNSILNSELTHYFDLKDIDWKECDRFALKSLMVDVCNCYKNTNMSVHQLSIKFDLSDMTVLRYLKNGNSIGLCRFDAECNKSYAHKEAWKNSDKLKKQKRPVYCHELNLVVESVSEAQRKYHVSRLREICGNPQRTSGGYHWSYVDQLSEDILARILTG